MSRFFGIVLLVTGSLSAACGHVAATAHTVSPSCPTRPNLDALVDTAIQLRTTVIVAASEPAAADPCTLVSGTTAELRPGHHARFIANGPPTFLTSNPGVLSVGTSPGPRETFGGITTRHVIVTLQADRPGQVGIMWEDCTGTEC